MNTLIKGYTVLQYIEKVNALPSSVVPKAFSNGLLFTQSLIKSFGFIGEVLRIFLKTQKVLTIQQPFILRVRSAHTLAASHFKSACSLVNQLTEVNASILPITRSGVRSSPAPRLTKWNESLACFLVVLLTSLLASAANCVVIFEYL